MLQRIIGYVLFIPFIMFYSYVLGPVLKAVLIPGGLALLFLILGPDAFFYHWRQAQVGQSEIEVQEGQPGESI
ncbi:hypothetical protein PRUB_a0295 [Pseudoalteromonas rubra]|uniref:Uncharacterized protein n=1 Tax=Pseudoalteromonas rubra TaxID=43658 RepID=A0A8T0C5L0_9GAMM|nr:hypothetical protein [Pseudoalteromonas rubra]KAF7785893.1 hypothetical protein PRUB_a0295 [Pseudoalteromonas rubra]